MSQVKIPLKNGTIDFVDLATQQKKIRSELDLAISRVLDHGGYIMGPEVYAFEKQMSDFCKTKHAITCANGTDAIALGLMAKDVGAGDAIFVPSFTFVATAEVVVWFGATPIYVDVCEDTYNMCPESLNLAIKTARDLKLNPKGIIAVDLFGQPADYDAIDIIAKQNNLWLICDAAQSFGATYKGRDVGSIGDMTTTSFYPAKPLGCYGDGGAIFTQDDHLADIIKSVRVHGQGSHKYDNIRIGMNGRLDTLQAAILIEKLKIFPKEIQARQGAANYYTEHLQDLVSCPKVLPNTTSVWAQYTFRLPKSVNRNELMTKLKTFGIPTVVYYPIPLHQQTAYKKYPVAGLKSLPVSEALAQDVLSLPISGYISRETQDFVIENLRDCLE